jgi:ABC-type ATPase with predicted acetyltransferase domain
MLETTLFSKLSFTIRSGDVVLICGPSGAGKTTFLSLLTRRLLDPAATLPGLRGAIDVPSQVKVSVLGKLPSSRPLINSLGPVPLEHALFALNVSGLAEAHLYVKRFRELSNGQRYRAMVAKLIASDGSIWVADEFCATLDPITASIVSRNLRRCSKELGVTTILAAANWSSFIHELQPDVVVHLRSPWDYRIFTGAQFRAALEQSSLLAPASAGAAMSQRGGLKLGSD